MTRNCELFIAVRRFNLSVNALLLFFYINVFKGEKNKIGRNSCKVSVMLILIIVYR